mgnify:CR=1 FL=1
MRKPELLSPAGDWEKLRMAVLYGADAVYLAGTSFGMRSFAGNFSDEELPRAVRFAHEHGVKVHATVNTMPRWDEAEQLPAHLEKLDAAGVDALILADLGAFTLAGKYAPRCQRHISTQQSVANHVCAQAWYDLGASRVVLAREVSLTEIAAIRQRVSPQLELEAFCHGAMCVSYSGRCLLSNYMTGRDSNRGECAQPCRYQYALMEVTRPRKRGSPAEDIPFSIVCALAENYLKKPPQAPRKNRRRADTKTRGLGPAGPVQKRCAAARAQSAGAGTSSFFGPPQGSMRLFPGTAGVIAI